MSVVTSDEIAALVKGQTIATAFVDIVVKCGHQVALRWKDGDDSRSMSWRDYGDAVARAATGLRQLGVKPGDRVVLMLRNIPEFHVLDTAVVFCGATPISIYNSSSPDQIEYLTGHSKAVLAIVEDEGFLKRFALVRPNLPKLKAVGSLRGASDFAYSDLLKSSPIDLASAAKDVDPKTLATVIYTSGTTGPPKGVMLDHENIAWTIESFRRCFGDDFDLTGRRLVSYLPMAHIAERTTSHYAGIWFGYEVTTCPDAGLIGAYVRETRPEIMFGVPRVWEKIHAGVMGALGADAEKLKGFNDAVEAAKPIVEARTFGRSTDEMDKTYDFLDQVAFAPVRQLLGFDALLSAITGAAPIPRELLSWYRAIGVPLSEIYGMSESSGPMTWEAWKVKPGTVGKAIPGCEVILADDGEVCCRGGNVFLGYLDDPVKTAEALDADGWLHSGDIGKFDEEGYLRIVDRKKELIITAGGKNISPANLEAALKMVPLIGQAAAIGDQRPFVSALVVLDGDEARAFAKREGIEHSSLADLVDHPKVIAAMAEGIERVMSDFNNAERVKKWVVLHEEWLPDSEELTPTSKLKRRGIHAKYEVHIESMYTR